MDRQGMAGWLVQHPANSLIDYVFIYLFSFWFGLSFYVNGVAAHHDILTYSGIFFLAIWLTIVWHRLDKLK